jgi:hypothetical protein
MSKNGIFLRSRLKVSRNFFKRIIVLCLCLITVLSASFPERLFSAEQKSFKVQKVESNFFTSFKNSLLKIFGQDKIIEIPPARKVTWDDLFELNLETHRPSLKLLSRLSSEVSIEGFIIPMEFDEQRRVTELLLVPYVPSCMHVPTPPPNQIVHVKLNEGKMIDNPFFPIEAVGHLQIANAQYFEDQFTTSYEMEVRSLKVLNDSGMDPMKDFFGEVLR